MFFRLFFSFNAPPPSDVYTLSLHDALPICCHRGSHSTRRPPRGRRVCWRLRYLAADYAEQTATGRRMTLEQLLGRLEGVRRLQTGYSAKCPSHDDRVNSLSVNAGDGGRLLLYCHAGCTLEAILVALRLAGRDLFPAQEKPPRRRAVRRRVAYEIRAATGALVAVHERLEYDDGTKEFLWRREGKRGLGGLAVSELPLYGSEDVAAVA